MPEKLERQSRIPNLPQHALEQLDPWTGPSASDSERSSQKGQGRQNRGPRLTLTLTILMSPPILSGTVRAKDNGNSNTFPLALQPTFSVKSVQTMPIRAIVDSRSIRRPRRDPQKCGNLGQSKRKYIRGYRSRYRYCPRPQGQG